MRPHRRHPFIHSLLLPTLLILLVSLGACQSTGSGSKDRTSPITAHPDSFTEGVTYDPRLPADRLTYNPLKFEGKAEFEGKLIELRGSFAPWLIGAAYLGPSKNGRGLLQGCENDPGEAGQVICEIRIVRFAQYGQLDDDEMTWLLELEPVSYAGVLKTTLDENGNLNFPGRVEIRSRLLLTLDNIGSPTRFRSKKEALLKGYLDSWPNGSMILQLSNGPLAFENPDQRSEPESSRLALNEAIFAFADKPSEFFRRLPNIVEAVRKPEGTSLSWTNSAQEVRSSAITHFTVYRNADPDDVNAWEKVATLPSTETSWLDSEPVTGKTQYLVAHSLLFPFGRNFEGLYGAPVLPKG